VISWNNLEKQKQRSELKIDRESTVESDTENRYRGLKSFLSLSLSLKCAIKTVNWRRFAIGEKI